MKNLMLALSLSFAAMALSAPVHAKNAACESQATEKKLAGAAKASFLKKCEADAASAPATAPAATPAAASAAPVTAAASAAPAGDSCEAQAAEKKLAGAAKASFVKKCGKDAAAGNAQASCDAKAADKKLAGAAKTSFTKKCVADAAK